VTTNKPVARGATEREATVQRALVCDPDAMSARFQSRALAGAGFAVTTCHTATACEALLRVERPSLLILALLLPDMDGLALLRRVRADAGAEYGGAPRVAIMVSALHAALRAAEAGADAFLHKPVSGAHLASMARELLSRPAVSGSQSTS